MARDQDLDVCEVIEIDVSQPSAGTIVDYRTTTPPVRRMIGRPFSDVVRILQGAGWVSVQAGRDPAAGNRVTLMHRERKPGRPPDDTLDSLHT